MSRVGVKYDEVSDKALEDPRFARQKNRGSGNDVATMNGGGSGGGGAKMSSTFDAFTRLAAGLDARSVHDRMADPNRPTWEQYKKDNEDKLDTGGQDKRQLALYRAELDRDREQRLKKVRPRDDDEDSNDDNDDGVESEGGSSEEEGTRKKKSSKKKHKKKHTKKTKVRLYILRSNTVIP
jgi:hypothetical protein